MTSVAVGGGEAAVVPRGAPSRRRSVLVEAAVVLAVASALAVLVTWPLVVDLDTRVSNEVDGPFQAWTIDWVQHALTSDAPLWDANIFAPLRHTLAYSDNLIGVAVPLLPLRALDVQPITQLNIALLLGLATSAAAAYLFGRLATGSVVVACVAGAGFAFGPLGSHLTAHLHTTARAGIPLAAAAAWWLADRAGRRASPWPPAALLAGVLLWQLSVSFYPGTYAVVTALIVLAVRWRSIDRRASRAVGAALVATVAGAGLLTLPYLEVVGEGRATAETSADVSHLGIDLLTIDSRLVVLDGLLEARSGALPGFPGATVVLLGAIGLAAGIRNPARRRLAVAAGVLVVVGIVLALGTAPSGWRSHTPYAVLFDHVPLVRTLRAAGRAVMIAMLGMAVLSGLGVEAIAGRVAPARRWVGPALAAVAVVGFLVEGWAPWTDNPHVRLSRADRALARDERPGGVLYLPANYTEDLMVAVATTFGQALDVYGTTAHHRDTPNGYSGVLPEEWPELSRRLERLPGEGAVAELRRLDVRFVVVHPGVAGTPWQRLRDPARAAPLVLYGHFGDDVVYEVPDG